MDLLTVLAPELGHLLGFDHSEAGVMADTLDTGVRHAPAPGIPVVDPAVLDSILALDWTGSQEARHRNPGAPGLDAPAGLRLRHWVSQKQ